MSTYRIKLRRNDIGDDGWAAFCEELAVGPDGSLAYRRSSDGNGHIGMWLEWEDETTALTWLLGFQPSQALKEHLRAELAALPDIEPIADEAREVPDVNYGTY